MDPRSDWRTQNYAAAAEQVGRVAERLLRSAGLEPGMELLDVACGSGNATIPAARAGARATGLDPSPGLLEIARERAADAMVEVEWVEGDPAALPLGDASFDLVVSVFGHMFAPDHERAAAELRRVCRPGGAIAVACWTPGSAIACLLGRLEGPQRWGTEEGVRALLGDGAFERGTIAWKEASVDGWTRFAMESFGPLLGTSDRVQSLLEEHVPLRGDYLTAVVPRSGSPT